jgi:ParB/RepB/Spo0J family partition protein
MARVSTNQNKHQNDEKSEVKIKTKKIGTATVDVNVDTASEKWVNSIHDKYNNKVDVKDVLVKTLPISVIYTDQDNPRKLKIDKKLLLEIVSKYPAKKLIENSINMEWIEDYINKISDEYNFKDKQVDDLISIVELAASIKDPERLINPITVWQQNSIFHLISGERRLLAHIILESETVESKIKNSNIKVEDITILQWDENTQREEMTLYEKLIRVEKIINENLKKSPHNISSRSLGAVIGRKQTTANKYLKILRYDDEVLMNAIEDGKIKNLEKASGFSVLTPEEISLKLENKLIPNKNSAYKKVKISKDVKPEVMSLIIDTIVEKFELSDKIRGFDLSMTKDINKAFNCILKHLEEDRGE